MVNAEDMVAMETCGPQPACVRCSASGGWCVRHNLGHPPQSTRPSPHRRLLSSTSCCRGPQHTHPYTFSPPEHRCRHRTKPQTPASTAAFAMPGMCIPVNVRFCPWPLRPSSAPVFDALECGHRRGGAVRVCDSVYAAAAPRCGRLHAVLGPAPRRKGAGRCAVTRAAAACGRHWRRTRRPHHVQGAAAGRTPPRPL